MKTLLINMLLLSPALTFAQAQFANLSSTDPNAKEFYFGVENYVRVEGTNHSANKVRLSASHSEVSRVEGDKYLIRAGGEELDTLNYYEDGKLILSEVFMIKRIPHEIARLANVADTALTVGQVLQTLFSRLPYHRAVINMNSAS